MAMTLTDLDRDIRRPLSGLLGVDIDRTPIGRDPQGFNNLTIALSQLRGAVEEGPSGRLLAAASRTVSWTARVVERSASVLPDWASATLDSVDDACQRYLATYEGDRSRLTLVALSLLGASELADAYASTLLIHDFDPDDLSRVFTEVRHHDTLEQVCDATVLRDRSGRWLTVDDYEQLFGALMHQLTHHGSGPSYPDPQMWVADRLHPTTPLVRMFSPEPLVTSTDGRYVVLPGRFPKLTGLPLRYDPRPPAGLYAVTTTPAVSVDRRRLDLAAALVAGAAPGSVYAGPAGFGVALIDAGMLR